MIKDFLSKLGASTKPTIGVSITPGVGLEMIEVDKNTKTVLKYAHRPLEYNHTNRDIEDYIAFQEALGSLFDELHLPRKSNIVITIPNIAFGIINLPILLTDEAVNSAIVSEVEQSYIFKRFEPSISWREIGSNIDSERRTLAYTAIQKNVIDGLKASCKEVGCTLLAIETSLTSIFKALSFSNLSAEEMKENNSWILMVAGQNSYSIFGMFGKKIMEYYEEPLALKSFSEDEVYNVITASAKVTLVDMNASSLYIVSETDLVSAEVLSMRIPFDGEIKFLESNKYAQEPILTADLNILPNTALQITPMVIGSAIYTSSDFPLKFNLTGQADESGEDGATAMSGTYPVVNIGGVDVELTCDFVKKISIVIGLALIIPTILIAFGLGKYLEQEKSKLTEINNKIQQNTAEIKKYSDLSSGAAFDLNAAINSITVSNRTKLFYYEAVGMSIPSKLWINYYMTNSTGGVDIKGRSNDVGSIYTFYKSIKQLVNNSNVRLYKLELASDSVDDLISEPSSGPKFYDFEITNMTETELNPQAAAASQSQGTEQSQTNQQKPLFDFSKPLFGSKSDTNNQTQNPAATSTPTPPTTTPSSPPSDKLPNNLQKIDKF